jgi:hypothetical protein
LRIVSNQYLSAFPLVFQIVLVGAGTASLLRLIALEFFFTAGSATFVLLLLIWVWTILALPTLILAALSLPILFVCH